MQETILIVYLVVAIVLVGIILLQQGKGAEMGASFGAGGANTVFGAAGSGNALTKATTILAILFFAIALGISYLNSTPSVIVDEIYDDVPAVEKTNLESELPTTDDTGSKGLESELPPTESVEASVSDAASQASDKADELNKAVDDTTADKKKKEDDNQ